MMGIEFIAALSMVLQGQDVNEAHSFARITREDLGLISGIRASVSLMGVSDTRVSGKVSPSKFGLLATFYQPSVNKTSDSKSVGIVVATKSAIKTPVKSEAKLEARSEAKLLEAPAVAPRVTSPKVAVTKAGTKNVAVTKASPKVVNPFLTHAEARLVTLSPNSSKGLYSEPSKAKGQVVNLWLPSTELGGGKSSNEKALGEKNSKKSGSDHAAAPQKSEAKNIDPKPLPATSSSKAGGAKNASAQVVATKVKGTITRKVPSFRLPDARLGMITRMESALKTPSSKKPSLSTSSLMTASLSTPSISKSNAQASLAPTPEVKSVLKPVERFTAASLFAPEEPQTPVVPAIPLTPLLPSKPVVDGKEVSKPAAKPTKEEPKSSTQTAASKFLSIAPMTSVALRSVLDSKKVNISVVGAPLKTIIGSLSTQSGVNILLVTKSDSEITMSVKGVTLADALQHLCMISGLKMLTVRNTVVIGDEAQLKSAYPKEYAEEYGVKAPTDSENGTSTTSGPTGETTPTEVKPPKEVSRVYTTKFQSAIGLAAALTPVLQKKGVSITALPNTMLPIGAGVQGGQGGQGGQGAGAGAGAGVGAGAGAGAGAGVQGGAAGVGGADSSLRSRRILLIGPKDEVESAILTIEACDIARQQVEITVTIHDVANDALKEEGFNWTLGTSTLTENNGGSINIGSFTRSGVEFGVAMKNLEQTQKAKLLASPNVTVMDGEQSNILVGEKRKFPVVTGTTTNGQFIFSTEEQSVGISLQVAADIASDGTITMALHPMVSSIIGFLNINGASYPQVSTRESSSTLTVKDGQTILMGGLLRDEEIKNYEQLPLVGKIPFFGELFKYRKTTKNSSQLVISITPRLIRNQTLVP